MQLAALIETIFRITESQRKALHKFRIKTIEDLLYHFPSRYGDVAEVRNIENLQKGETAVVFGRISNLKATKAFRKKIPMGTGELHDDTGKIQIVWFNQPYLAKMIPEDALVRVEGKVSERRKSGTLYFSNPKIEKVETIPHEVGNSLFRKSQTLSAESLTLTPENHALHSVYSESRGITSNWFYHAVQKILKTGVLETLTDPLPQEILKKYHLPSFKTALIWIHAPQKESDAVAARKRFSFEEVFLIQLEKQKERRLWQKEKSFTIEKGEEHIARFTKRFPFSFTNAQNKAVSGILEDFRKGVPMARILEGDVGSGKTAVAATTSYAVVTSRPQGQSYGTLQVAYMCPTEILAKQQFENFISFFSHLPINIGLITSSGCRKFPSKVNPHGATDISKSQLLKWVQNGEIPILVGTHALIQKVVKFKHLAYAIIDEQHRFGVAQRKALVHKEKIVPHLLSMTATPIPRTLALTMYGDLDLTILDELPPGRKPIITELIAPKDRDTTYEKIRKELQTGRQCYIITPRIDEPDPDKEFAVQARSAKAEAKRLKERVFPEFEIGVMHGKLKDAEKESVMEDFKDGKISILVSTSVVEVGVNIENATVIVIEGAERFGLAQLHQLRGRVLRSTHQAYCYVFTESGGKKVLERLRALQEAKNGFELAEYDLKFRGAGKLSGREQWGVSDVAMEALQNLKMVEAARFEAKRLLEEDATLSQYPFLIEHLASRKKEEIHFE
ncbi:MAG TPA: ATP-dependent DNA helicase RecG [Candidatus Taylorbacteria bacterium]|nr:MAG: ATP-dependent DNA helicase RecG [Parcubacteria group bacterium GW2011_GWA2_47_64]KKU96910.1 MAG: ATP-dependent DNA helicase RecG [Parcubacteria group bacterium GW2011_GWC2_48_17]HBV01508.1 ATP-dependent DNA helicase RecG [Candidatus Taylorbacteria bacterium]